MSTISYLDKIKKAVGELKQSPWIEEAKERKLNKEEIRSRQKIALNILRTLRQLDISQKQLAEMLSVSPQQVNKWVKGSENFTLDTIFRIQKALGVELIEVIEPKIITKISDSIVIKRVYSIPVVTSKETLTCVLHNKIEKKEKYNQRRLLAYA